LIGRLESSFGLCCWGIYAAGLLKIAAAMDTLAHLLLGVPSEVARLPSKREMSAPSEGRAGQLPGNGAFAMSERFGKMGVIGRETGGVSGLRVRTVL
jgi:hypothetical protein